MKLGSYKFHLTQHAHSQYLERVEPIEYEVLKAQCVEQLKRNRYTRTDDFIQMFGVWWVIKIRRGTLNFVTCYGKTALDIPQAKKWARLHHDRIDLKSLI